MGFVKDLFIAKAALASSSNNSGGEDNQTNKEGVTFVDYDGSLLYSYTVEEF
jgi:hypothetical protein